MVHMIRALILGAGMVPGPGTNLLLKNCDAVRVVNNIEIGRSHAVIGASNGSFVKFSVTDISRLRAEIKNFNPAIILSFLPAKLNPSVAEACLAEGVDMVNTSYVEEMSAWDSLAKKRGLRFLCEIGVDPGIDHMTAMSIFDQVRQAGGQVKSFRSYCGGLPAPESNTNPLGYKFSWAPKSVLIACQAAAQQLENGQKVITPNPDLFYRTHRVDLGGQIGELTAYPNRNSYDYQELYGLGEAETVYRGTLRYPDTWCEIMGPLVRMGALSKNQMDISGLTVKQFLIKLARTSKESGLAMAEISGKRSVNEAACFIGLFSEQAIPEEVTTPFGVLDWLLSNNPDVEYADGERDMIVMRHDFQVTGFRHEDRQVDRIVSTLIEYGIPGGDTAMARTVSLPAVIAALGLARGEIDPNRELAGVIRPVYPEIYEPTLAELARLGIEMEHTHYPLQG